MARLFGTDGVRGRAGVDLTAPLARSLAASAAAVVAGATGPGGFAIVGRDPRESGEWLDDAVTDGLIGAGLDVVRLGVVPTPAVAHLVCARGAALGVMISASHNPAPDNGIKFFAGTGYKLADEVEDEIERRLTSTPPATATGTAREDPGAVEEYAAHLLATLPHPLTGLRVVVDGANGAASAVAPQVLREAGADVITINTTPDGQNINAGCGSTHLEPVRRAVTEHAADVGIAHDGDADRCLAIAADGSVVDGDAILAICALGLQDAGRLTADTVVTTVMTNLGFKRAMGTRGIAVVETLVGDRYVIAEMQRGGYVLGGEQSGHVVFGEHATTGDGLLTAIQLLGRMAATGSPLAELAAVMQRLPQVLLNVTVADRDAAVSTEAFRTAVEQAQTTLGSDGRVLVRPSGTEPVIRVMVEAPTQKQAQLLAERLAAALTGA